MDVAKGGLDSLTENLATALATQSAARGWT